MRKIWIALLVMVPCLFARGDEKNYREVSGGIVTNVLNESGTVTLPGESKGFVATTLGTALWLACTRLETIVTRSISSVELVALLTQLEQ